MFGETKREIFGGEPRSTNNRMELMAAIQSLEVLKEPCVVQLHSDSAYVINCFKNHWYERWERNGWKTASKAPVENQDLWERLIAQSRRHSVRWVKVKGHSNDVMNNRADELARAGSAQNGAR